MTARELVKSLLCIYMIIYAYICMLYAYVNVYIYIYAHEQCEREREKEIHTHAYLYSTCIDKKITSIYTVLFNEITVNPLHLVNRGGPPFLWRPSKFCLSPVFDAVMAPPFLWLGLHQGLDEEL